MSPALYEDDVFIGVGNYHSSRAPIDSGEWQKLAHPAMMIVTMFALLTYGNGGPLRCDLRPITRRLASWLSKLRQNTKDFMPMPYRPTYDAVAG